MHPRGGPHDFITTVINFACNRGREEEKKRRKECDFLHWRRGETGNWVTRRRVIWVKANVVASCFKALLPKVRMLRYIDDSSINTHASKLCTRTQAHHYISRYVVVYIWVTDKIVIDIKERSRVQLNCVRGCVRVCVRAFDEVILSS